MMTAMVGMALVFPTGLVLGGFGTYVFILRRRHGGGLPLPAFLIKAEDPSPSLRNLIARVSRSVVKDYMAEWSTVPPALKRAIREEINRMAAEAFATHDGRRK